MRHSTLIHLKTFFLAIFLTHVTPTLANDAIPVVASFSILADMVKEVGGPHVAVTSLVGANKDAHLFDPTPADARLLANAKLVFVNGLGFEGWMNRLVKSSGYAGPLVIASKGIQALPSSSNKKEAGHQHGHNHAHGASDPHAWLSLINAKRYVENIKAALIQAMPAQAAVFETRATDYIRQIEALDQRVRAQIASIPIERLRVITSHDSFGYFAAAYAVRFYALQGLSTGSEPSAADVVRIINEIKNNKVTAIFSENISDPRILERVSRDSGAVIGGVLYADALSLPGTQADTYLKMFAHNVSEIVKATSLPTKP